MNIAIEPLLALNERDINFAGAKFIRGRVFDRCGYLWG